MPATVSPDGTVLLFDDTTGSASRLMAYAFRDRTSTPFGGVTSLTLTGPEFSPDGKWVAYSVREPGHTTNYTYVQPYPATGAKYQISTSREGGHHQVWSADGKELFYTPGPGPLLVAVKVTTTPAFSFAPGDPVARTFDITGPGVRFLGLVPPGTTEGGSAFRTEIRVVLLKQRLKQPRESFRGKTETRVSIPGSGNPSCHPAAKRLPRSFPLDRQAVAYHGRGGRLR